MWHSRPPRDPPLHGKNHLKFPFWLFDTLPYFSIFLWMDEAHIYDDPNYDDVDEDDYEEEEEDS